MAMLASVIAIHDAGRLFEPDAILPEQFYSMFKRNSYREPESRLMAAVLEDAVSCLSINPRGGTAQQRKHYEEAMAWVTAQDEGDWIFSFKNICESLGIDPNYLRRGLMRRELVPAARPPAGRRTAKTGHRRHKSASQTRAKRRLAIKV